MRIFQLSALATTVASAALSVACGSAPSATQPPLTSANTSGQWETPVAAGLPPVENEPQGETDGAWGIRERSSDAEYAETIRRVTTMVGDGDLQRRVARRQLSLVNVTWEDTGRFEGSSVGPNISDLTLQVRRPRNGNGAAYESNLLPVIRYPNFSDRTGDVAADKFFVRVGNERQGTLRTVPLTEVLRDPRLFSALPESLAGTGSLLASRDSHFLVSAQAVFLPIPKSGKAEFNPVLFNYQSYPGAPAVLSILVTRQGTSLRVIENRPEEGAASVGFGQELYFDNKGQRAAFTAERKTDVEARIAAQGGPRTEDDKSALARGADVLFLVQVPLMQPQRPRRLMAPAAPSAADAAPAPQSAAKSAAPSGGAMRGERSDVEQAVLGHGPNLGRYAEGFGRQLVRDTRFPVRITVQFYKATSNGVVSDVDLDGIAKSIGGVYEHADAVGSLVLPEGDRMRPTAWQHVPPSWFPW
ncbi:MAG: hypothetical protein U0174_19340 [Polyangiaceae bacterium]